MTNRHYFVSGPGFSANITIAKCDDTGYTISEILEQIIEVHANYAGNGEYEYTVTNLDNVKIAKETVDEHTGYQGNLPNHWSLYMR